MGIKGLPTLIKSVAGTSAIQTYKFSKFKGMKISVDTSLIIHQTVIAIRSSGKDMVNKNGELTSHLHGLFYKILIFLQNEMVPIFVFDGTAPDIKSKTIEKRRDRREQAETKLKSLSDSEDNEYIKNFKQTFRPTKENIKEARILLDLMGIPYIEAPGEADVICSWLAARRDTNKKPYVNGVCSDDSDMLPLGAPYLFKDMLRFMSMNKPVKVISLNKTLVKMNLTMDQFVNMCALLGTDYCDNIKGIGPKNAYKLISKYGTLEKVLQFLHKTKKIVSESDDSNSNDDSDSSDSDNKTNEQCMIDARNYFLTALKEIDESDDFVLTDNQLKLRQFQEDELMDFMCVKHGFDVMRVKSGVDRLREYYKIMNVTRENTARVHKILQPISENYIFTELSPDKIDFLSSDEEQVIPNKKKPMQATIKPITTKPPPVVTRRPIPKKCLPEASKKVEISSDMSLSDFSDSH